ncbi:hypothetical protein ACSBR2_001651 [Camellia fascicularis]
MAKWVSVLYTACVWWCFFSNTPATCLVTETDRLALIAFKTAIDQDPFGGLRSWNDSVHYCDWKGIWCSRRHPDRVVKLELSSQGLVGSLSPHIGNLSFLKTIALQNNSFHGPIPQEISHLFRLRNIILTNNSFNGEIPTNLSRCSNLEILDLMNNNLTGNIPAELGSLSKLKVLGLGLNNLLAGTIPPSLGNLSVVSFLSLGDCGLQGDIPKEIAQLQGLTFVQLGRNSLSGTIPAGIYNISSISMFEMYHNQLHGYIPSDIGLSLPNLKHLGLAENRFIGPLPTSLSNASGLQQIGLFLNDFVGPIPRDLGRLLSLRHLTLGGNRLQDDLSFISSLTNCTSLQSINMRSNLLRGPTPESIANLSSAISIISMADNQIHGNMPSGIGNLLSLTVFEMAQNQLSGPIPTTIGKLYNLHYLFFDRNNFTQLPSFGNLTLLNILSLGQNNIYGSIPLSLGNCHSLLVLDLSHNNLNGSIPTEIMRLSSISIFFSLANNNLTGGLPSDVGYLKNLAELDVSNNRLSGPIPDSLSNCESLEWLHLEGNSFQGMIPQSLRELRGLRELDLSHNNLSGLIPSFLGELHLEKLNLSFNKLHGEVPMKGVFQNGSAISVVGNNDLCGGIPPLSLPPCLSSKSNSNKFSHNKKVILIVVVLVLGLTMLVCLFFIILHPRRISRKKAFSMPSLKHHLLRVSYAELLKATDGFSKDNLIGVGNYGSVYKGILNQVQTVVAVKVLSLEHKGASKSFMSECKALRRIRHRNVLKILSFCSSMDFQGNEFMALVYEFMVNGSLEKWLHKDGVQNEGQEEESSNLTFIHRLNIAKDVASAIEYLHCHCDSTIIHGDLKPSNVLLDDEMTAHVGDFGLAKIISTVSSEEVQYQSNSTAVRGTIGYVAPEYATGNRASPLADVYSYGILLLEMLTGKKPTDNVFTDGLSLHSFVESALPDQVMEIVDPRILSEDEPISWLKDNLVSVLRIGIACSMESPRDRMQIQYVVNELCKIKNAYENPGLSND